MRAGAAGRVIASKDPSVAVGDHVVRHAGCAGVCGRQSAGRVEGRHEAAPLPVYLGTLGMPGMTAYFGLLDVGQPKAGETVVVPRAAGAVGFGGGEVAKIKGCRVVGIAGGQDKCRYVRDELGFDAVIDYKSEDVTGALRKHCPTGG